MGLRACGLFLQYNLGEMGSATQTRSLPATRSPKWKSFNRDWCPVFLGCLGLTHQDQILATMPRRCPGAFCWLSDNCPDQIIVNYLEYLEGGGPQGQFPQAGQENMEGGGAGAFH